MKERLPGAATALALQAVLFALLLHPFTPEPEREEDGETIFLLPRLLPPPPDPMVIDARKSPQAAAPASPSAAPNAPNAITPYTLENLPPYARPPSDAALLAALGRALDCRPSVTGRPSPFASCRGLQIAPGPRAFEPAPALPVKREAELADELARVRSERVPCTSLESVDMGFGQEQQSIHVDLKCLAKELSR